MQGLLKNVSGLPLCFKSLKTQACLQQHLPSTSAGCGQLFMLRLNMGVHFDLLGNKLWEVHLWLRVNTPFKASTLQSTDSNSHVIQRGKLSKCHPESLVKLGNDQCDIHKQWILLSCSEDGEAMDPVTCTHWLLKVTPRMFRDKDQKSLRRRLIHS